MARPFPAAAYARLKAATGAALAATPDGSAAAFAKRTRVVERSLRLYADHSSDLFAPIDVIADIEHAARQPLITNVLADLNGFIVVRAPGSSDVNAMMALKETGEAAAAIAQTVLANSLGPGALGAEERRAALREVREAIAALTSVEAQLKQGK